MAFLRLVGLFWGASILIMTGMFGILRREPSTGAWITFAYSQPESRTSVYRLQPETGEFIELTTLHMCENTVAWSPSADRIAYSAWDGNTCILFLSNADGSEQVELTDGSLNTYNVLWSHDGHWIYFIDEPSGNKIYRIRPNGTDMQLLYQTNFESSHVSLSPDGEWLLLSGYGGRHGRPRRFDLYRMRTDSTEIQQLTDDAALDYSAEWSPDGNWIAFVSDHDSIFNIYLMRPDGTDMHPLNATPNSRGEPHWSPNGQWIAFYESNGNYTNLYLMRVDGSVVQQLTHFQVDTFRSAWSADSQSIVFITYMYGAANIHRMDADGSNIETLTGFGFTDEPMWSPTIDLAWSGWELGLGGMALLALVGFWVYRSA